MSYVDNQNFLAGLGKNPPNPKPVGLIVGLVILGLAVVGQQLYYRKQLSDKRGKNVPEVQPIELKPASPVAIQETNPIDQMQ